MRRVADWLRSSGFAAAAPERGAAGQRRWWFARFLVLAGLIAAPAAAVQPAELTAAAPADVAELRRIEVAVTDVVRRAAPATVSLRIPPAVAADGVRRPTGAGSAVVVTSGGLVLTAAHVIEHPGRRLGVTFADGTRAVAQSLGVDFALDLGLLQLEGEGPEPGGAWPHVPVGEPGGVATGDWVVALGHPGGFDPRRPETVRLGRVIRLRPILGIQSDCALIGGDSGGPLLDLAGNVVGAHSRIGRSGRTNVSASVDDLASVREVLPLGAPAWRRLGAAFARHRDGLRARAVDPAGVAGAAGLRTDDVVVRVDGAFADDPHALNAGVAGAAADATLTLRVRRDGGERDLEVRLAAAE